MKKLLLTLFVTFLAGCSSPPPHAAAPTLPRTEVLPDWTIINPTSWQPSDKAQLQLDPQAGKVETFVSSPLNNAHMAVVTVPWASDPNDFGVSQVMSAMESGYHIQTAHSAPIGKVMGTYMLYTVDDLPEVIFAQVSVGHKDHAHTLVCVFNGEVSEVEQNNCLGSLDTFKVN